MVRALAVLQFATAIVLTMAAMWGFYRVALDMVSSSAAELGKAPPGGVLLEAPALTSREAAFTEPVKVEDNRKKERSPRVLLTFTAFRLLAGDGKLAGDLS